MVLRSRRDYLDAICKRYQGASKQAKGIILDEFCMICGYNRKYAIRLLRCQILAVSKHKSGPRAVYRDPRLLAVLKRIWFATDQMCSKKLKAAIPLWLPFYEAEYEPIPPARLLWTAFSSRCGVSTPKGEVPPNRERS